MNAVSRNNLWVYLQSILTADDRNWLKDKLINGSVEKTKASSPAKSKKYKISPSVKKLMGSVRISPENLVGDDRMKYILNK